MRRLIHPPDVDNDRAAAELAATQKNMKYAAFFCYAYTFPIALGIPGLINKSDRNYITELCRRLKMISEDPLETTHLFQRFSTSTQLFNAVAFQSTFTQLIGGLGPLNSET